jgi:2-haloacid dehalogenase
VERWATFDCYGTLVDWRGGIRSQLVRLFPDEDADALLERYHELEPEVQRDGALSYRAVMTRTLERVVASVDRVVPPGEEDALGESLPRWPVFAEVPAALAEARARGWRLAVLSNTDRAFIEASLERIGVPFEQAVVASEIGSYKPAHRHWQVFREGLGAEPIQHVHVAQSLFHDIVPSRELGIDSIWINRLGEESPLPTRERPDLNGLADTLDELAPA